MRSPPLRLGPLAALGLLTLAAAGTPSSATARDRAPGPRALRQYMPPESFRRGHPEPREARVYHDAQHTRTVRELSYRYALARGLRPAEATFVADVALLHDWDRRRRPGTPARVPATLEALRRDFAGKQPLWPGFRGRSVLRERFGWTARELQMALAMIQRTEFPFGAKHPSPAYRKRSPVRRYATMLARLPAGDRAFVLREAPLLSEYADKLGGYALRDFHGAVKMVRGLVTEINTSAGRQVTTLGKLRSHRFLDSIGRRASFAIDRRLARHFDVRRLKLPDRAAFFAALPARLAQTFKANLAGFRALDRALRAGASQGQALSKGARAARRVTSRRFRQRRRRTRPRSRRRRRAPAPR